MKILKRDYSSDLIKKYYSKVVKFYDLWGKFTEEKALNEAIKLANIKNGEKLLEAAAGTGKTFEKIIRNYNSNGENIGIDISPHMLKKAKQRLSNIDKNKYNLIEGDILDLPYKDNYFDIIINNYMLDLFPESKFDEVLKEFKRVLKPEGKIVITFMSFGDKWYHKIWFYISKYFPKLLTNCRPILIEDNLKRNSFEIMEKKIISQNTFPSEIIKAKKK